MVSSSWRFHRPGGIGMEVPSMMVNDHFHVGWSDKLGIYEGLKFNDGW